MSVLEIAEAVEKNLHNTLGESFNIPKAVIYSVKVNPSDELEIVKSGSHGDIYDLLESGKARKLAQVSDYVAVLTTGWAAPLPKKNDEDVAPSQHPERRRIRLLVVSSQNGVASVIRFEDNPTEIISDNGKAQGALAEAVKNLY